MENYNAVSLQGGGQDSENNPEEETGEDGAKKEETVGADNTDPLSKLPAGTPSMNSLPMYWAT